MIDVLGKTLVGIFVAGAGGHLDISDRLRVPHVAFAFGAPVVFAVVRQYRQLQRLLFGVAKCVTAERFFGQHVKIHALDTTGGTDKRLVDHLVAQPDRFKDLSTLVALQSGDANFGHHLEHPLGDADQIFLHQGMVFGGDRIDHFVIHARFSSRVLQTFARLVVVDRLLAQIEQSVAASLPQGLEGQVRIDRVSTVAN